MFFKIFRQTDANQSWKRQPSLFASSREKTQVEKILKKKSDPDDLVKPIERKTRFWEHQPEKILNLENFNRSTSSSKKPPLRSFCGPLDTSMENTNQLFCDPRTKKQS